jgi:hypothetical protein
MKTGRLLKFHRPGHDLQAYLYLEPDGVRAVVYDLAAGQERGPVHTLSGTESDEVEAALRSWIDAHYPRS